MPFNVVCMLYFGALAAGMLYYGDPCLAAVFAGASYVFYRIERARRRVLDRPDPFDDDWRR